MGHLCLLTINRMFNTYYYGDESITNLPHATVHERKELMLMIVCL